MAKECKYFPEECWELIFNRLHHQSDLESVTLVCKEFLALTNVIRLHLSVIHHGTLSKLIHRFSNLNSIDVSNFQGDLELVLFDIANCVPNLVQLDLSTHSFLPIKGLKELGRKLKGLRVLKCRNLTSIRDSCLYVIAESLPFLEELDISYPRNPTFLNPRELFVSDSGIEFLSVNLRNLRKINVSGNSSITDRSIVALYVNCLNLQGIGAEDTLVTLKGILSIERACAALSWISVSNIHNIGSLSCLAALQTLEISDPCLSVSWKLEVSDFSITDEFLLLVAKASLPLQRLMLFSVANFTLSGISSLLYAYQTLKSLSLIDVNLLTDESMNDLSQYLQCLVTINLSHCMNLTVSTLFTLARNCPSLEAVNLGYTGCVMIDNNDVNDTGLGMKDYFHTGVKNPRIRTVCLKFTPYLNDDSLTKVALMCPNTETLDVHGCGRVTEAGIASALEVCNHIRNLDFGSCPLIKHIGKGTELPDLQVINAAGSALSDEGLAMIGSRCPRLLKLNLEKCEGLTAEGIQAMVKSCTSLREINLRCCHQISACSLHRIVFSCSSLRRVFPPNCDDSYNDFRGFALQNKCLVSSS